jgi:hypothetical protein
VAEKKSTRSDHLLIGGDFNVNLDDFERENIPLLNRLGLKVVHYDNQRDGEKVDGLICDKDIKVSNVTVYSDNVQPQVRHTDDSDNIQNECLTTVVSSGIPKHVLDHHPIRLKSYPVL